MKLFIPLFILNFTYALELPKDFLFGIANAPAHVEDKINDPWMRFAKAGKSKAFLNQISPEKRLEFWTKPEVEINLASELGVQIFRLGVDWQRLVPNKSKKITNLKALERYKETFKMIKDKNMKIMLTLFHHSLPDWAIEMGGWPNKELVDYFIGFSNDVIKAFKDDIDFLITFNEPNVYSMFSYVTGMWPPGKSNIFSIVNLLSGDFYEALDHMAYAHNLIYREHKNKGFKTSVAHNIAHYKPFKWYHTLNAWWANKYMNYYFLNQVQSDLDFLGFNYYGAEYLTFNGVAFKEGVLYNDAGRAMDSEGLYLKMKELYFKYSLPLMITENGAADSKDLFRSYYILKHLEATQKVIQEKIPVLGYIHWTLTDNFEWSDGYCPKFGLVSVDRKTMQRKKRESFYFYQKLIQRERINEQEVEKKFLKNKGKLRDFCRSSNGVDALDTPTSQFL